MKMHKVIGEARASTRSIFTLALVGVLLTFTGQAFGQADEKSGLVCKWSTVDWQTDSLNAQGYAAGDVTGTQGLSDLDAVDGNVIRFNGAIGPTTSPGVLQSLVFPSPLCDWDNDGDIDDDYTNKPTAPDFFSTSLKCGAADTVIATGENVFGATATTSVTATFGTGSDSGQITFAGTDTTATEAVSCTLELDWVSSNPLDGPITYEFQIAISPTPHAAPGNVRALAESYNSAYVEWTLVTGDDATTDDDPTTYIIAWETSSTGARPGSMPFPAAANPVDETTTTQATTTRQGARVTGLVQGATYTFTVSGRSGTGPTMNIGRSSAMATSSGVDGGATAMTTVELPTHYNRRRATDDDTYKLSVGETVELDPKTYFMNLALPGRVIENLADQTSTEYAEFVREAMTVTYRLSTHKQLDAIYVSTDPASQNEDLVRIEGLEEGTATLRLEATFGETSIVSTMRIMVIANNAPRFSVTQAELRWYIDKTSALEGTHTQFQIDLMEEFIPDIASDADQADPCDENESNEENCDEELTFSLGSIPGATGYTSHSRFFEITEDNENDGLITSKRHTAETASQLSTYENAVKGLEEGDEIGFRVTVTDASGGKDTMDIIITVFTEGNFPPSLVASATNARNPLTQWVAPLSQAKGGGSVTVDLASKFSDPEDDVLCYQLVSSSSTLGNTDEGDWVELDWEGTPGHRACNGSKLTIEQVLPDPDPESDGFGLLGAYGTREVTISVRVYESHVAIADRAERTTSAATVKLYVVYGSNGDPNIRDVALVTGGSTYYASGNYEINEGADIRLTFTADDAQPNGDLLCWRASRFSCSAAPCVDPNVKSPSFRPATAGLFPRRNWDSTHTTTRSTSEINNGQGHEYQLVIRGWQPPAFSFSGPNTTITDFERTPDTDGDGKPDGMFKFKVCVSDLSGHTDELDFEVKIKDVEEPPEITSPVANTRTNLTNEFHLFMLVGDYSQTVNARARDGDGDTITYAANWVDGCDAAELETDASTGVVTVTPTADEDDIDNDEGKLTCKVEISVSTDDGTAYSNSDHFTVTVKKENTAPEFAEGFRAITWSHPEYRSGKPYTTTVGGKIRVTDADGDAVTTANIELSPSNHFQATATEVTDDDGEVIGYDISIAVKFLSRPRMDFEHEDGHSFDMTLTVADEYGGSESLDIGVDLTDVNEPPTLRKDEDDEDVEIEDQMILVGVEKCIAKASDLFFDPDHRDQQSGLYIEAKTTRPGDASVIVKHNEYICVTGHNPGSGAGRVTVTATDRDDEDVTLRFQLEVEANQPPEVVGDGIPDMEVQESGRTSDIDLTAYFDDGDVGYEEELTFSFSVDKASVATGVLIDGTSLRIYGDSKGTTEVTVTATDQDENSVDSTFEVEVIRNDPPVANADAFDDVEQYIGREYDPIDARDAFTDEGDTLTYYVSTKNSDVATAAIKYDDEGGAWVVLNLHSPGTTSVTVTVYDSANNSATNSFDLTVLARNDPPMLVNEIEDVEVEMGAQHDVSLEGVFEDEGSLDYDVSNEDENIADVLYRASNNSIRIYANNTGTTTVVVVATDNIGQTASDSFDVTVVEPAPEEPTNSAPVLSGTLEDQTVTAGEPISVSIEGVFTDPDGDELTYTAESDDTNVATVDLTDLELTISGVNAGSTVFKITATDGEFNVVGEFDVEVETIPVTIGQIPNQTLQIGGDDSSLSVGEFFFDQDGDVLTYTIETSGNAAEVSIAAADVAMSPFTRGSTSVMVTATDPKGRSATQTFSIEVSDSELRQAGLNALAGTARAYIGSTAAALGSRLESSRSDTGMGFSFGNVFNRYMPVEGEDVVDNSAAVARNDLMGFNAKKDLLDSTWNTSTGQDVDFNFNLPTFDSLLANNFSRTLNGNGGIGSFSIWGTVDAQNFEGEGYDGSANSMFLGVDVQTNECWIFGVTAARNTSESDYSWGTASQALETTLTTIMPYFSFEPVDGKTSVWGVYGRGSGDADTTVVNATAESSDLSFNLGMFGGRREFAKAGSLQLAFRGDVAFANLETEDGSGAIDDLAAQVNRIRAGIEGSFSVDTGNGGKVTPFGELAFRNDGGDGLTGNGFEVAGGVRLDTNTITIEARGRVLATHSAEDFNESGVSLMVNINPSSEATGLSFSFTPQWGASSESGGMIWSEAATVTATPHTHAYSAANGMTLNSKLAYGFSLNHGKYLLTPYVDVQNTGWYGKSVMIGSELTQLIAGPRTMNMKMFFNASDDSVDQVAPKLGIQALFKF